MFSIRRKSLSSLGRRQRSKSKRRSRLGSRHYTGGTPSYSIPTASRLPRSSFENFLYKNDIDLVNSSRRSNAPTLTVTDYDPGMSVDNKYLLPETSRLSDLNTERINIWDKDQLFAKYRKYFGQWGINDAKYLHQPPYNRLSVTDLKRLLHDTYGIKVVGYNPPRKEISNKEKSSRVYWNV